jgi:hypothetical protein
MRMLITTVSVTVSCLLLQRLREAAERGETASPELSEQALRKQGGK